MIAICLEEDILMQFCAYAPQNERSLEEKKYVVYDELKGELDMHSGDDFIVLFGDLNGHIGSALMDLMGKWMVCCRSEELGRKNANRMLLVDRTLSNTWFKIG